jgi:hypothetical protein
MSKCEYCDSVVVNKTVLKTHLKTNKKCLAKRGLSLETNFKCEGCSSIFITSYHLTCHQEICKEYIVIKIEQNYKKEIENIKAEFYKNYKKEVNDILKKKEKEYDTLKISFDFLQTQYNQLLEEYKIKTNKYEATLERFATEAINKPTTTNNTVNNNILRDHLSMKYTIDSLTDNQIEQRIRSCMTEKIFWEGQKGIAKMCIESIVKTPDNKMMLCCTDTSRGKFKLFDIKGNLKEDIDARLFTDRVGKFIKIVGCEIKDTIQENIDNKSSMLEEKNGPEKDDLLKKMEQLGYSLFDIYNIDDHERNKVFRNELAMLSSLKKCEDIE